MRAEIQSTNIQFGSERDVERLTGRKRQTLQKDRCLGRGFPFYRVGRKIVYDLDEVRRIIRAGRVNPSPDYFRAISKVAQYGSETRDTAEASAAATALTNDAHLGLRAGERPSYKSTDGRQSPEAR
jgi:hypothetical protein